jgi:hypothetical protein
MDESRGAWAGGGAGYTWDGEAWRAIGIADLGAWTRFGRTTLVAGVVPTSVADPGGSAIRFADAELATRWTSRRLELGGTLGGRTGRNLPVAAGDVRAWGSASVVAWLAGPLAIAASGGSYPVDFTQGFPGGRYMALGLRLAPRPPGESARREHEALGGIADAPMQREVNALAPRLVVTTDGDGVGLFRVLARGADRVELTGDVSDWQPLSLTHDGGDWWSARVPLVRGTHQVALRLDAGAWVVPSGLLPVDDEFGGTAGLLVVP